VKEAGFKRFRINEPPSMELRLSIQAVAVVPRFAPMIRLADWASFMMPEFTRPTVRTVVAEEDCTIAVMIVANRKPLIFFSPNLVAFGRGFIPGYLPSLTK
jgi:hypothetical protein